jgi:BirA family biotin operon repressor/biotin-[acetyl-CoA-carboxylase] ligase
MGAYQRDMYYEEALGLHPKLEALEEELKQLDAKTKASEASAAYSEPEPAVDAEAGVEANIDSGIKWPNDIIVNEHKVGGILSEMVSGKDGGVTLLLGIGINVNNSSEDLAGITRPLWPPSSLAIETAGKEWDREALLGRLGECFNTNLGVFEEGGPEPFLSEVVAASVLKDREFTLSDGTVQLRALYSGVTSDGALVVDVVGGGQQTFYSAEIIAIDGATVGGDSAGV